MEELREREESTVGRWGYGTHEDKGEDCEWDNCREGTRYRP